MVPKVPVVGSTVPAMTTGGEWLSPSVPLGAAAAVKGPSRENASDVVPTTIGSFVVRYQAESMLSEPSVTGTVRPAVTSAFASASVARVAATAAPFQT